MFSLDLKNLVWYRFDHSIIIIAIEVSQRFGKSSKLIRKSLIKVYDHLQKVWKKFHDPSKRVKS